MPRYSGIAALALTSLLAACASTGPAPVEDRSLEPRPVERAAPGTRRPVGSADRYRVERGDTLYSIAFRHGVDYRELAGWNGIGAPYTIYVGQELRVTAPTARVASAPIASTRPADAAPPRSSSPSPSRAPGDAPKPSAFEPVAATPSTPPPVSAPVATATSPRPGQAAASTAPPAPVAAAPVAQTPPVAKPEPAAPAPTAEPAPAAAGEIAWRWPAEGAVAGTFVAGDQTKQGIDIVGKAGDPVRAAADGTVVYSGNGLVGYGELIIIKHNPSFLSAYGHNRKRLVKEGDKVKSGQGIAEMGSSSATRDSLHFEIRRNGKPGNPLDYLPRR